MKWPFRKRHTKGKRAVSQRQSHHRNVERELRGSERRGRFGDPHSEAQAMHDEVDHV